MCFYNNLKFKNNNFTVSKKNTEDQIHNLEWNQHL